MLLDRNYLEEAAHPNSIPEGRRNHRHRSLCRLARVAFRHDAGLWRVHNISDTGMMLGVAQKLRSSEKLSISLSDRLTLRANVVWSGAGKTGVEFEEPISSLEVLRTLVADDRLMPRRSLRLPVSAFAIAADETGMHTIRVRNVSVNGLGVSHGGQLRRGMPIKARFSNGEERRGVVCWSTDVNAGILLFQPFSPAQLESACRIWRTPRSFRRT